VNHPGSSYAAGLSGDLGGRMARLMFYILLAVVLMTLDHRGGHLEKFRGYAGLVVEPAILLIEAPFVLVSRLRQNMGERRVLLAERDELDRQLRQSRAQLLLTDELARDNAELRDLLQASRLLETRFQAVELRNIDLNPYSHRVLINRGKRHGITEGQPVIDASGVVGQVDEVLLHSAKVILLSDPDHAMPVRVERTRLRTIAYGSGRADELRLTDLPMNADLVVGDRLLTSGLGGRFPAGLPVAEVTSVERPVGEAFAVGLARPMARLEGARHFLVLSAEQPADDETTEPDVPGQPDGMADEHVESEDPSGQPQ
jgi:rod shape-determining protein MreC